MNAASHQDFMALALQLAERGRLTVSPNPMVGCVIVKNNHIVGRGFHLRAGEAHAEIYALQEAGVEAKDATLYLTLEPCCHYGRTPPCTQALIRARIKKVYVACLDINPKVCGKGIEELRAAGIEVEVGLCEAEAQRLNEIFFHYMTKKRPFVIAKWAMSLDGKIAVNQGDARQISCVDSNAHAHHIREQVDAILIGANTARLDNPQLTARLGKELAKKQPLRLVLSRKGLLPLNLNIFADSLPSKTLIMTTEAIDKCFYQQALSKKMDVVIIPKNKEGYVCLSSLLDELGRREITSLLVEGGRMVHEQFFKAHLVNKIHVYLSPAIIGPFEKKQRLTDINCTRLGGDFFYTANV